MICVDFKKLKPGPFLLAFMFAFLAAVRANKNNDLLNQQLANKRDTGFLLIRGPKNDQDFGNDNLDHNNEKKSLTDSSSNNFDIMKVLDNILKLNNNGNAEELNEIDQTYPTFGQAASNGQTNPDYSEYESLINRKFPSSNIRFYGPNEKITPLLGLMTRYGSPKRAGFVPMRGRKSDPSMPLAFDEDNLYTSFKWTRFLPMRGKKTPMDLDELEFTQDHNQITAQFLTIENAFTLTNHSGKNFVEPVKRLQKSS